ncbi:hypothetical protein [Pinirhizobacter sp.]|uniref:hypothetical protein n=1 Tax=Pinirhizobacter sp. TaxID=2950432 RepID=UPI002F409FA9
MATSAASSGSDASPHAVDGQGGSVHNPDDIPAHSNTRSTHARAAVGDDLPDDGTRGDAAPASAKPDVGWPALLPGSIW